MRSRLAELKTDVDRLREELHRRIGTSRSRVQVVERFKVRSEWHDRTRLAALAEQEGLAGGPEDRLTEELARYVFDQGLSALSKPTAGGLEPDLFDPHARFYVEAKQYQASARSYLLKGFAQLIDTVNKFRGAPSYEVDEAFYVIFRLSGPYYILPKTVRVGELKVHIVLVDLAPPSETGRRQKNKPVMIDTHEFIEARRHHAAAKGDPDDAGRQVKGRAGSR